MFNVNYIQSFRCTNPFVYLKLVVSQRLDLPHQRHTTRTFEQGANQRRQLLVRLDFVELESMMIVDGLRLTIVRILFVKLSTFHVFLFIEILELLL